ncbi:aldo/keto reductase [Deinococcus cellulosilyticus]|uniref:Oxidoreductase n=1 Tax=Deinococcus cellulosilyticus (strain DSM 18568 / NBRC 106333 / KACC 11606 / 5516J-15) TaxID=1223518 RepID=A0A511MY34_DEIC1|nr:aldo/keto reductase [Deinococcus cellulosilyticus]GEM45046.1 oxidoreductase [Deinococcus cellulosilyticus NBRC 106333 = KACC 11606]
MMTPSPTPSLTDTVQVGRGATVTRLGLGASVQGGLFQPVSEEDARAVFQAAWDAGIRFYDTAPWYGYGESEFRLGDFLQQKSGFTVSSKVGRLLREGIPPHPTQLDSDGNRAFKTDLPLNVIYDYSYDGVMRSFEETLQRMKLDHLDMVFIHDPDSVGVTAQELMQGAYQALVELREQGLVKGIGAGMNQWEMPHELLQAGDFDVFLLAGRYTLLEQHSMPFLQTCIEKGAKIIVGGVFNSGLLANPKPDAKYNYSQAPELMLQRALAIREVCELHGISIRAAAMQFPLAHPAVASVLLGVRTLKQLQSNLQDYQTPISADFWKELQHRGLIAEDFPFLPV